MTDEHNALHDGQPSKRACKLAKRRCRCDRVSPRLPENPGRPEHVRPSGKLFVQRRRRSLHSLQTGAAANWFMPASRTARPNVSSEEKFMFHKGFAISFAAALFVLCGAGIEASGQEPRSGTVTGEVKAKKDSKDGKNTVIEVLAPGEEKSRSYHVQYDEKIKGPLPE